MYILLAPYLASDFTTVSTIFLNAHSILGMNQIDHSRFDLIDLYQEITQLHLHVPNPLLHCHTHYMRQSYIHTFHLQQSSFNAFHKFDYISAFFIYRPNWPFYFSTCRALFITLSILSCGDCIRRLNTSCSIVVGC